MNRFKYRKLLESRELYLRRPRRTRNVVIIVLLVFITSYFVALLTGRSSREFGRNQDANHFVVVVEASSSNTNLFVYQFQASAKVSSRLELRLVRYHFQRFQPDLSFFVDAPEEGAKTVVDLIKKSDFFIPLNKRKDTPVLVRGTAWMDMIPTYKQQRLMLAISNKISALGYNSKASGVDILEGSDEGVFSWLAINILYNRKKGDTMALINLGEGSAQITYEILENMDMIPAEDRSIVTLGSSRIKLYTHSFQGVGLLLARFGILKGEMDDMTDHSSFCVDPVARRHPFNSNTSESSSLIPLDGLKRFEHCRELAKIYLNRTLDWEPLNLPEEGVAAVNFFFSVAADARMVDIAFGGTVVVDQYRASALLKCQFSTFKHPWTCLDLAYIYTVLRDVYQIHDNLPIFLYKNIHGHEVSWALGLAYKTILNLVMAQEETG